MEFKKTWVVITYLNTFTNEAKESRQSNESLSAKMEFHWTRTRLIKAYKSFDLSTNKINEDCRSFLHKNQGPVATRRDGLGTDHVTVNRLFDRTTWTVDYRTKKCCSKPSTLWETPIYASLLMCFRLLNSTKNLKKSKNYLKRQKAIIR